MKIRLSETFPYNYISGIYLNKEFNFVFPEQRNVILRSFKEPNLERESTEVHDQLGGDQSESDSVLDKIASFFDLKICIRRGRGIKKFGEGSFYRISITFL